MGTTLRWIGAVVLPFVAMTLTAIVGNFLACTQAPWRDNEYGEPSGLALISTSAISGIMFSCVAYKLAPKYKMATSLVMLSILILFLVYGCVALYEKVGGFGVVRYVTVAVGAIITTAYQAKQSSKE